MESYQKRLAKSCPGIGRRILSSDLSEIQRAFVSSVFWATEDDRERMRRHAKVIMAAEPGSLTMVKSFDESYPYNTVYVGVSVLCEIIRPELVEKIEQGQIKKESIWWWPTGPDGRNLGKPNPRTYSDFMTRC